MSETPEPFSSLPEIRKELRKERERSAQADPVSVYAIMDSSLSSFFYAFRSTLPPSRTQPIPLLEKKYDAFRKYIEETLRQGDTKNLAAIEFGGPGYRLFDGFTPNFFKQTLGVCLKYDQKNEPLNLTEEERHRVLIGNIFDESMYSDVRKLIKGKEVGLIISRMAGPLHDMTRNPRLLSVVMKAWYRLLTHSPSLMFVQFPQSEFLYVRIKKWQEYIQEEFGETMELQVGGDAFRLLKKEGAPIELPLIDNFENEEIFYGWC